MPPTRKAAAISEPPLRRGRNRRAGAVPAGDRSVVVEMGAPASILVASPEASLQKSRPTQHKRARERARLEKQQQKAARRQEQKKGRIDKPLDGSEDPDIAGIVPGPQPSPWEDD
jgi:hypothetical protein